jgi:type VI secretion system protein ImpM
LDGQLVVDQLFEEINQITLVPDDGYRAQVSPSSDLGLVVDLDLEEPYPMQALPHLLDAYVKRAHTSYSYWHTSGSNRVEPCMFVTPGLPSTASGAAMWDGLWEDWGWTVPVRPWRPPVVLATP